MALDEAARNAREELAWLNTLQRVGSVTLVSDDGTSIHVPRARMTLCNVRLGGPWPFEHVEGFNLELRIEMLPILVRAHWFKRLWWWIRRGFWHKRRDEV